MKLPRDMDAGSLIKALSTLGYRAVRQTGSHIRLECAEPPHSVTIPNHHSLRTGTLSAVLSDVGRKHELDREALFKLLWP